MADENSETGGESVTDDTSQQQDSQGDRQQPAPPTFEDVQKLQSALRKERDNSRTNAAAAKELADIKAQNESSMEKAVRAARSETEKQVSEKFTARLVGLSLRAAAGGRLQDPADAETQLRDRAGDFLTNDGEVNHKAVEAAVEQLLTDKPYLARRVDAPPDYDGGQRNGAGQGATPDMNNWLNQLARRPR